MKLQFKKRRLIPVALAILVLVVGSGVAYAFWTAGGSGTGNANANAGTVDVTAYMTSLIDPMYPGDSAQTIKGDFTNTNSYPVHVSTVTVSIDYVMLADGITVGTSATCSADDFTLLDSSAIVDAEISVTVAPDHTGAWGEKPIHPTIQFNDTGSNQNACKNATVHLLFTVL